ncbi:hypothetical protein OPT61_g2487 [Boeremia exigua]|uniref:Uncharacterized protein n=1 Tax=Boeremia exigua TaxID=749465 RepID=A0ACC2ILK7_9PLEO|nr:hypothetical protein OPT61_g2487 [Boeremia exigua]
MDRPTRHKSCVGCIQTKRRCDRNQPKCQRCITRGSDCQYVGSNDTRRHTRRQQVAERPILDTVPDWGAQNLDVELLSSATLASASLGGNIFEFPQHPFNLPLDSQSLVPSIGDLGTQPRLPSTDPDNRLYDRVEYCATRLSLLPDLFAKSGQNMFIHRQTFQSLLSPALQQAMSACALYCTRTSHTKALVRQILHHNVQHLLATTDPASASNHDLIAALQALILYQLIRLFDGDIRLRTAAEADTPTTILWASELRSRACASTLPLHPVVTFSSSCDDWHIWLLSESLRRTVVTAFMLRGVYQYLKSGTHCPTVVGVYFTAQEGLWNAQSELGWNRVRNEKVELQVLVNACDELMALASPTELEELGVLVTSTIWGLDATKEWLGYACSVKHGLTDPQ